MNKRKKVSNLNKNVFKRIFVFILTFIVIYVVLMSTLIIKIKKYDLKVGEIPKSDIKAPREVEDRLSTQAKIKQAVNSVTLAYSKRTNVKDNVINDINSFFSQVESVRTQEMDDKSKVSKLKSEVMISVSEGDLGTLISLGDNDLKTLQELIVKVMSNLYDNNNIYDDSEVRNKESKSSIDNAKNIINNAFNSSNLSGEEKSAGINISNLELKPNYYYDKEQTDEIKNDVKNKVTPVIIKKDQTIVREGEPVTVAEIEVLKDLGLLNNNNNINWYIYFSLGAFVLIVEFVQWYYLFKFHNKIFMDFKKLVMINVLDCISIILARVFFIANPFLIPFACIPMLMALLLDDKISLTISVINCIFISAAVNFDIQITVLAVFNAVLGPVFLRKLQQRNDIFYSSLFISLFDAILATSQGFLLTNNLVNVLKNSAYCFLGGIMSSIFTIGFLPIFETMFDIVTTIKLLELSNPNNPLLKKLLIEAPGTYNHSVMVANIAEVAAEKVGGSPVLTRICSYYHDIGKVKRPYFFKENQIGRENPHDKITPNLSALIIISHVKDGIELAKEYKIPNVIQKVIEQHHGTSLVKYFYVKAKNSADSPDDIKEENFRYPGPIPDTKEAGIIMLADGIEAAVRSVSEPTKGKIDEMVNSIIKDRLDEGQLDNCDLTLKDISLIRSSFMKSLLSIYHNRIEYPVDKWENKKVGEKNDIH